MIQRIQMCARAIRSIWKGKAILIEDKGETCSTFVGAGIDERRFRVLMVNQLKAAQLQAS